MSFRIGRATRTVIGLAFVLTLVTGCGGGDEETQADSAAAPAGSAAAVAPSGAAATTGASSVSLSWSPPTEYEDGKPFADLAGYRILYGVAPGKYTSLVEIAPGTTSHSIRSLAARTYYFSITAYNHQGVESTLSNEVAISLN
jgi:hypothetical protein